MLTNQGNTQVYSPFGSYVVEQHGPTCEHPERADRDTAVNERPSSGQELAKAA